MNTKRTLVLAGIVLATALYVRRRIAAASEPVPGPDVVPVDQTTATETAGE